MSRMPHFVAILVAILPICTEASAGTVILYDNLKAATDGQDLVPPESDGKFLADSFSTGKDPVFRSAVKVKLVLVGQPDFDQLRPIVIELRKDNGKSGVGDLIAEIGQVTESTVKSDGPIIEADKIPFQQPLAANSRYWIVLTDITPAENGKQTISWTLSSDTSGTGVANELYVDTTGQFPNNDTDFGPFEMQSHRGKHPRTLKPRPVCHRDFSHRHRVCPHSHSHAPPRCAAVRTGDPIPPSIGQQKSIRTG